MQKDNLCGRSTEVLSSNSLALENGCLQAELTAQRIPVLACLLLLLLLFYKHKVDRLKWRKLVAKSSVVPQRPSRLRDR